MPNDIDIQAIKRFLSNESDYIEAERVAAYLLQNPQLLDEFILFDEKAELPLISSEEKRKILNKVLPPRRGFIISMKKLAVAASVIGVIAISILWFNRPQKISNTTTDIAVNSKFSKVKNNTTSLMKFVLPDSSEVQLKPSAEIMFDSDFKNHRDVFLIDGEACFEVYKNPSIPFSVFAKGIKTTALGTNFWVESPVSAPTVVVRLQNGKVVLTSTDSSFKMKNVMLSPGLSCYINKRTGEVKIMNEKPPATTVLKQPSKTDTQNNKAVLWSNDGMQFKQAALKNVLSQLEARYNVKIIADENTTKGIVLTGKLYATDSLLPILKSICDMNKLDYEIRNDSIFLKRK
ncbi:FecR family protein [Pinibacter soli]|uniref:FecR family protein n=1 Tax=Pinibacter soli TaxID=3044211 RepID=A0ABT6RH58_9BACT|nr:FecR family protein [Pinibacter soli]MDI3321911.1 FecR family protein [Pinibacter soli]